MCTILTGTNAVLNDRRGEWYRTKCRQPALAVYPDSTINIAGSIRLNWQEVFDQLKHVRSRHSGRLLPIPKAATLSRFENASGFVFPDSYREFISLFGQGTISGWYTIFAPLGAGKLGIDEGLEGLVADASEWWEGMEDAEFVHRMIPFGLTGGRDYFAASSSDAYLIASEFHWHAG